MTVTRVQRNTAATLSHTFYVGETPTAPTGTPTYAIVDANGTAVSSGNATVASNSVTAPLAAQSQVAWLTVAWTGIVGGNTVTEYDQVEVTGGFLFGLAEGRASDSSLADTSKYPAQDLIDKRVETEVECEQICDQAWVVRYRRVILDGTGTWDLVVPDGGDDVRGGILLRGVCTIRRVSVAPTIANTFVDLTANQLAAVAVTGAGALRRTDGNVWTEGVQNIVVEYEYGNDAPPADLKSKAMIRFRQLLNLTKSGVPERAQSYTVDSGGTYRLSQPGAYETGSPEVDAAYWRYSRRQSGNGTDGKPVPYGVTMSYAPQRYSLFHR